MRVLGHTRPWLMTDAAKAAVCGTAVARMDNFNRLLYGFTDRHNFAFGAKEWAVHRLRRFVIRRKFCLLLAYNVYKNVILTFTACMQTDACSKIIPSCQCASPRQCTDDRYVTWPDGARPLLFVRTSIITANVANVKTTIYCSEENTKLKRLGI
jgi:hypothetical protein